jgi:hypothetical protein
MADAFSPSQSLLDACVAIPDPRGFKGRRHSLPALLALLVAGFAGGCNTMTAIVAFGREHPELRARLGFTHEKSPSQSTYSRLFEKLDVAALREVIVGWLASAARARKGCAASVDGKALRATGDHFLHVFLQDYWLLVDLFEVGEKNNEHSAFERELDGLLQRYPWLSLLTFDAMFCQHKIAEKLIGNGKKAIFQVKENQPETLRRLERFFSPLPKEKPDHRSVEKKKAGG